MAWDDDQLRAEVLGEFAESAEFARAYDEWSEGAHYIDRTGRQQREPATEAEGRRRELHAARCRRYRERQSLPVEVRPLGAADRMHDELRRRAEERARKRMEKRVMHEKLPDERRGLIHHFTINYREDTGQLAELDGYVRVSTYPDGRLGEIFLTVGKPGSSDSWCDQWAILASLALQHGLSVRTVFGIGIGNGREGVIVAFGPWVQGVCVKVDGGFPTWAHYFDVIKRES